MTTEGTMTEAAFQKLVLDAARLFGWHSGGS